MLPDVQQARVRGASRPTPHAPPKMMERDEAVILTVLGVASLVLLAQPSLGRGPVSLFRRTGRLARKGAKAVATPPWRITRRVVRAERRALSGVVMGSLVLAAAGLVALGVRWAKGEVDLGA